MPVGASISKIVLWRPGTPLCTDVPSCAESGPVHRDGETSPLGMAACKQDAGSQRRGGRHINLGSVCRSFPCTPAHVSV